MVKSVRIREEPPFGCIDLRFDARSAAAVQAVERTLGAKLPDANTWTAAAGAQVLWQAFDEWLVLTADGRQTAVAESLRAALTDVHSAVTDVTDLRVAFEIAGPRAREVLQKGCAVDLHPRAFGAASCVTAALARVRVTLRQLTGSEGYEVLVERSYAAYLRGWLEDAALEYG